MHALETRDGPQVVGGNDGKFVFGIAMAFTKVPQ